MTIGEAIGRVRAIYNKGAASDDSALSDRLIYAKLLSARTLLIKREIDKHRQVSDWIVQTIKCLELEVVGQNDCPCTIPQGCKALRTKSKLPKPVQSAIGPELEYVTTMDGGVVYSQTDWVKKRYKSGNKYTSQQPDYMIKDGHMYLIHRGKLLKYITVGGVFEDPLQVVYAEGCGGGGCVNPYKQEFPVDQHLMDGIMQFAVQELVQIFKSIPQDENNNASEDKFAGSMPQTQQLQ